MIVCVLTRLPSSQLAMKIWVHRTPVDNICGKEAKDNFENMSTQITNLFPVIKTMPMTWRRFLSMTKMTMTLQMHRHNGHRTKIVMTLHLMVEESWDPVN